MEDFNEVMQRSQQMPGYGAPPSKAPRFGVNMTPGRSVGGGSFPSGGGGQMPPVQGMDPHTLRFLMQMLQQRQQGMNPNAMNYGGGMPGAGAMSAGGTPDASGLAMATQGSMQGLPYLPGGYGYF